MPFLSQASHLGSLLLPHDAFQEHAAHPAEWSAELNSKGSERTCIRSGLATFLHYACTAHSDLVVERGADTSWGRTGIAAKMQYSFGTPITRSKRRRLPNAMPQGQHTPRRPVCATVVRCTRRRQHPVGLGPRCVALSPRPRDAPCGRCAGPPGALPDGLAPRSRVWEGLAE